VPVDRQNPRLRVVTSTSQIQNLRMVGSALSERVKQQKSRCASNATMTQCRRQLKNTCVPQRRHEMRKIEHSRQAWQVLLYLRMGFWKVEINQSRYQDEIQTAASYGKSPVHAVVVGFGGI
jgi:uncharacterized protein with PIN domain